MTVENVSTDVSTPEVTTSAPAAAVTSTTAPAEGVTSPIDVAPAAEAPPYVPNYKYKAAGKDQEFPEWAKGLIKDADMEKTIRDVLERADGLDVVKQERGTIREQFRSLQGQHNELVSSLKVAGEARRSGDWRTFFETLEVSDDDILKYALKVAELREAPENVRQEYEERQNAIRRNRELENELSTVRQQLDTTGVSARTLELSQALQKPDVQELATVFDERFGKPGAFEQEIIDRGVFLFNTKGIDAPVEMVVADLMKKYGWLTQQSNHTPTTAPQTAQASQPAVVPKKPVIPNIAGRGTSPVKNIPGSIKDLKKLRDEAIARG